VDNEPDQEPAGRLHEIGAADECPMLVLELRVADHRRLLSIRRQREAAEEQTCANELHLTKMSHMLTSLGVRLGYAGAAGVPGACGSWGEPLRGRRGSLLRASLCRSSGAQVFDQLARVGRQFAHPAGADGGRARPPRLGRWT